MPWACGLAFSAALGYGLLAGLGVPVHRACLMIGLVLLWRLRFRHLGAWWPLLLAFNGVLLLDPPGQSCSRGSGCPSPAVAVLVLAFGGRLGPGRWWQAWTRAQWLIAIGLLPLLLALGLPISVSGPLANLLAVPWISLVVLPLALLGTALLPLPYVGEGLLWLAGGALDGLFKGLALVGWAHSGVGAHGDPALGLVRGGDGRLSLVTAQGVPFRLLGWPMLLLPVFLARAELPPKVLPTSGSWMSARAWRFWCAPAITRCCTTPARVSVISIWASGWYCRHYASWG